MAELHMYTTKELLKEVESRKEDMKGALLRLVDEMYEADFVYEEIKEIIENH